MRPDPANARRVWAALAQFRAPLHDSQLTIEDLSNPGLVFWIGYDPERIDVITAIDGVPFEDAWEAREYRGHRRDDGADSQPRASDPEQEIHRAAEGHVHVAWIEEASKDE